LLPPARGPALAVIGAIAIAIAAAGFTISPAGVAIGFPVALALGVIGYAIAGGLQAVGRTGIKPGRWGWRCAAVGAVSVPAVVGVAVLTGSVALAFGLVLIAGLVGIWLWRRRPAAARGAPTAPAVPVEPAGPLDSLSDAQLCMEWRRSFLYLSTSTGSRQLDRVCEQRRRILDELERRDAQGFKRWINSGARAAGDPAPYLTRWRQ